MISEENKCMPINNREVNLNPSGAHGVIPKICGSSNCPSFSSVVFAYKLSLYSNISLNLVTLWVFLSTRIIPAFGQAKLH